MRNLGGGINCGATMWVRWQLLVPLVVWTLLSAGEVQAGFNNWSSVGPVGKVHSLAVAPGGSPVYAGGNGSIYRSTNAGTNWNLSLAGPLVDGGIVFDPADSQIAYAAGFEGVFKTGDGGSTWTRLINGPLQAQGVAVDPLAPTNVYVASTTGIFKSTDSGASWTNISTGLSNTNISSVSVASNTIYIGTAGAGVWKSPTGVISWTDISFGSPLATASVRSLAVNPSSPSIIYAAVGSLIYKTADGGASIWSVLTPFSADTPRTLAIDPTTPTTVYAGVVGTTSGLYISTDSGTNWGLANPSAAGDCNAIAIRPDSPGEVYFGKDNGVQKTADAFTSVSFVNTGLSLPTITSFAEGTKFYAGGGDGIWDSADGVSWTLKPLSMPASARISSLAVLPGTPSNIFAGVTKAGTFQTFQTTDGGNLWIGANSRSGGGTGTEVVGIAPNSSFTTMAVAGDGVYRWDSGTWSPATNTGLSNVNLTGLANKLEKVYAATQGGGIFISSNFGTNWSAPTTSPPDLNISSIAVSKASANMLAGSAASVYKSNDGGLNWSAGGFGPVNVTAIDFHSAEPDIAIVGTKNNGLFYTVDAGNTWKTFSLGLPSYGSGFPAVNAVSFGNSGSNLIHVGLEGGGVYHRTLKRASISVTWGPAPIGAVSVGLSQTTTYTISNFGDLPLNVNAINFGTAGPYTVNPGAVNPCAATPFSVSPGASCNMDVTFTPGVASPFPNSLVITDNAAGSPHNFTLSGNGITPCAWTNAAGGAWSNPSNWSCGYTPLSPDGVDITLAGNYTVTVDVNATINDLQLGKATGTQTLIIPPGSTLTLNSGSLVVPGGDIDLSGGTLAGPGTLTINTGATFNWSGGIVGGSGALILQPNAVTTVSGAATKILDGRFVKNHGSLVINGSGSIQFQNNATLINHWVIDLQTDAGFSLGGGGGLLTNELGSNFKKTSATGLSTVATVFNNKSGAVNVFSGTLSLAGGGQHTGNFNAASGATLAFGGGTHKVDSGSIGGLGTINFSGGTVNVASAAAYTLNDGASSTTSITGGFVNLNSNGVTENFNLSSGTFTGTGSLNVAKSFIWSGGTIGSATGAGYIDIYATAAASISGASNKLLDKWIVSNSSTLIMSGSGILQFANSGKIQNFGTFDLQSDTGISGAGSFLNFGTGLLKKSVATAVSAITSDITNSGTVDVVSGTLSLNGNGTHSGVFNAAVGANLVFGSGGGTQALSSGSVTGAGGIHFGGADVTIAAPVSYTVSGSTNVTAGTVRFNNSASTTALNVSSGMLTGIGTLTVNNSFNWTGGIIGSSGSPGNLTLLPAVTGSISGAISKILDNWQITNDGSLTMTGSGSLFFSNNASLVNNGTFDFKTDAGFNVGTGSGVLVNNATGVLKKSASTGTTNILLTSFSNSGSLNLQSGILNFSSNIDLSSSTSSIALNGTTVGTQYGRISSTGNILGGGTLDILLGYAPAANDSFTIISCAACGGTYSLNLPALSGGKTWNSAYSTNSLVLTVVSDTTPPVDGPLSASPGNGQALLSWSPAGDAGGVASYVVSQAAGTYPADCSTGTNVGNVSSYTSTGLNNGTPYYFRVCAVDNAGNLSGGSTATTTPVANFPTLQVFTDASGKTAAAINSPLGGAVFNIPAGTVLTDINGNPVTGMVKVNAGSTSDAALFSQKHPAANLARDAAGNSLDTLGSMIDISLASISSQVRTIAPFMTVSISVPSSFAGPGAVVKYFSYDGTRWNYENSATVKTNGTIDMQVTHLSLWAVATFKALPTGKIVADGTTTVNVSDALRALRIAIGLLPQTAVDLANGDVAPLVNGKPVPDGTINVGDAVVILRKSIGLVAW